MKKMMMVRRATRAQVSLKMRSRSSKRCRSRFSACLMLQNGLHGSCNPCIAQSALSLILQASSVHLHGECLYLNAIQETCSTTNLQELLYSILTYDVKDVNGHCCICVMCKSQSSKHAESLSLFLSLSTEC